MGESCRALVLAIPLLQPAASQTTGAGVRVERLGNGPIVSPQSHPTVGPNIQGPSLIRVPGWVKAPLGKYYLYFADHKGKYIRLAYADDLLGPWRIHAPGALQIADSYFLAQPPAAPAQELAKLRGTVNEAKLSHDLLTEATTPHIASPDVHVDSARRRIVMYFHGLEALGHQVTRAATSRNGIRFRAQPEILGRTYLRAFRHGAYTYAMAMPGLFYRSRDGLSRFEEGPRLFNPNMRRRCCVPSTLGKGRTRRWSRPYGAPLTVTSTSFAILQSTKRTDVSSCSTPSRARVASRSPRCTSGTPAGSEVDAALEL
jgi:hypothetical protein